jgi:hypothetical protein
MAIEIKGKEIHVKKILKGATKIAYISKPLNMMDKIKKSEVMKFAPLANKQKYRFTCVEDSLLYIEVNNVYAKRINTISLNDLDGLGYGIRKGVDMKVKLSELYRDLEIEPTDNPIVFIYDIKPVGR